MKKQNVTITKKQLRELWFWANAGVGEFRGGALTGILKTLPELKRKYKIYGLARTNTFKN